MALPFTPALAAPPPSFGTGQILQQVQPNLTPPKILPAPVIKEKKPVSPTPGGGLSVRVTRFRIVGNTLFTTSVLHRLVRDGEGKTLTFSGIRSYADRITAWYKDHGFPLSRAILPGQTIQRGVITIRVVEARYGKIRIHNASRVTSSLLFSTLSPLSPGSPISAGALDSSILLLSDIPGTHVASTLAPGALPGTADLDVDVLPVPMVSGNLSVNDYGDPYTGSFELNGNGTVNNLFHHGDTLSVNATTSFGGFEYGRVAYETVLNGYGTRIGAGYSAMDYRLGGGVSPIAYSASSNTLLALGANGYAQTVSGWINQPLVRRTRVNLTLHLGYDRYILSDTFDQATGAGNSRFLDIMTVTLSGNGVDLLFGGGTTDYNLTYTPYYQTMEAGMSASNDPYAVTTPGFRGVWRALLDRTQILPGEGNTFYLSGNGQIATGALDPAEQYVLGGPLSVRGYATAVLFGDEGYSATAELRHATTWSLLPGTWQSSLFFDDGGVTFADSFLNLLGPGLGEAWAAPYGWFSKVGISIPVGGIPQEVGSTSPVQAWFEVVKTF